MLWSTAPVLTVSLLLAQQSLAESIPKGPASAAETCQFSHDAFPNITYLSTNSEYKSLNEDYFKAASWLGPACIFAPTSAKQMACTAKVLVKTKVPFAVPTQLRLSKDKPLVSVGPANSSGDIYRYLEPAGVSVVGGRLGVVGILGFLLGGGMSFFTNEYGWGSATVKNFEVVLANGKVVTATANNKYADLVWALRGGGNSFAIIASMELKTVSAPVVTVGTGVYGDGQRDNFLDTIYHYAVDGSRDKKSAVIPNIFWSGEAPEMLNYMSYLFYNGNNTRPSALSNFPSAHMPADLTDFDPRTMGQWATATEVGWDQLHGRHGRFYVLAFQANKEAMNTRHLLRVGCQIFDWRAWNRSHAYIYAHLQVVNHREQGGGGPATDPMGIDESQGPIIWIEESLGFPRAEDEDIATRFYEVVDKEIASKLAPLNVSTPYLHLHDAGKGQPVFEGYDPANLKRLGKIRHKYDHNRIYSG